MDERRVKAWIVVHTESERGWGQSTLGAYEFATEAEAVADAKKVNDQNTSKVVPDYYVYARLTHDTNWRDHEDYVDCRPKPRVRIKAGRQVV